MSDGIELNDIEALIRSAEDLIEENRIRMTRYSNARNNVQKTLQLLSDVDSSQNNNNQLNSEVQTPNNDDDVIFVRSESIPEVAVINLCTPINRRRKRRAIPDSSYNSITIEDVKTIDTPQQKRTNTTPQISDNDKTPERLICPICLESALTRNPTSTMCGHIFCRNCITNALKVAKRCPICKKKILSPKYIHPIYLS